ncbi:hypothetical protein L0657_26085 [Dyadobacter sp. CY345]|uniref:hypothetical protein n=1 Tax=Dyadobacter sp. CY345 TaxID=2909335 RepID=UPI001F331BDD|nr:hypothetical protein [Dyadobacter sp. CY345]MCF2447451.1 hypothetical protein [Dyadobacter sp. CY345]
MYNKSIQLKWYQKFEENKGIINILFYFIFAAVIIIPRWYYLQKFGLSFPFWDQWDAEGEDVVRPLVEGRFKLSNLWLPHNEHRVLPTRIVTLICFKLTGIWSNLNEARVNVFIAASTPVLIVWLMQVKKQLFGSRCIILLIISAQFVLPFGWENILVGFQSQFFFLMFFSIAGFALATFHSENFWAFAGVLSFSLLGILTMASGILLPLIACGIYIFHSIANRRNYLLTLVFVMLLLTITILGYQMVSHVDGHERLRAADFNEFFEGFTRVLSWPSRLNRWLGIPLWLPAVIGIPIILIRKNFTRFDLLMAACFAWTFAQVLAISYGRGHELDQVTSRYTDLLTPGLISVSWFSIRLLEEFERNVRVWVLIFVIGLSFYLTYYKAHKLRFVDDMTDMKNQSELMSLEVRNVAEYYKTHDKSALDKPQFEIPYPDKERLQQMLDLKTYQSVLPRIDDGNKTKE